MTFEPVTPETLDAAAERLLAPPGDADEPQAPEPPAEPEEAGEAPAETEEAGEPAVGGEAAEGDDDAAPPAAAPATFRFDDLDVTVDEELARNYALFEHRLRTDPDFMAAVAQAIQPGPGTSTTRPEPPPPVSATMEPPAEVDFDDPALAWIAGQMRTLAEATQATNAQVAAATRWIETQQADVARSVVEQAVGAFATERGLTADEIAEVRTYAGTRVQLPANAATDPAGTIRTALETAYWAIPKFRERAVEAATGQAETDRKRQRKLGAVAGSSGSVPRNNPEPRNADERKAALKAAVYEMWQGNSVNE